MTPRSLRLTLGTLASLGVLLLATYKPGELADRPATSPVGGCPTAETPAGDWVCVSPSDVAVAEVAQP